PLKASHRQLSAPELAELTATHPRHPERSRGVSQANQPFSPIAPSSFGDNRPQDVELRGSAAGQDRRYHAGQPGQDDNDDQGQVRKAEHADSRVLLGPDERPAEEYPDQQAEERALQGNDHRLPADGAAELAAGHPDRAHDAELAGAFEDGQRERVAD